MDFTEWQQTEISPLAIQLDDENPRIEAKGLEQAQIRRLLLENEDVSKLAHKIVQTGGLFPHDLMVVGEDEGQVTVYEGNRRVSALQMLLNPSLIPEDFADKFPRADEELKVRLARVQAVMAPDRASADRLIAQIHAFNPRKQWAPLAKYRYAYSRYEEGQAISDIADDLGAEPSEVRRFIRRYNIYKEIMKLQWTPDELRILRGEDIYITPFLYPFERLPIRELIGEVFDTEGRRNPGYTKAIVDRFLKNLARDALIPQTLTGKPTLSTRGTGDGSLIEYFQTSHGEIIADAARQRPQEPELPAASPNDEAPARADAAPREGAPRAPTPRASQADGGEPKAMPPEPPAATPAKPPKRVKPDDFFESFSVPTTLDQKLIALASEISRIDYGKFPISAAMLLRALLEEVLREHLKRTKLEGKYRKAAGARDGLKSMILFSADKSNSVFKDAKTADQLARFQNSAVKDDLDNVVHTRYGAINKNGLLTIRPWVRPIIESIVKDEWS